MWSEKNIQVFQKINLSLSRFAIFLVYFWFGVLKVFGLSPASPLVLALLSRTLPFFPPTQFLILFGVFEMIIGLLFLWPKATKLALVLLGFHLITTILPLLMMPEFTWTRFFVPTMEGQYIIKNILIIALAINIASNLKQKYL